MAKEQVARLYRAVKADPALKEKLNTAPNLEVFVRMAQAEGYDFSIEEWQEMTSFSVEELECELSEIPGI
jgi:predicted ribosomally synthesized peptide with nif11-like leader